MSTLGIISLHWLRIIRFYTKMTDHQKEKMNAIEFGTQLVSSSVCPVWILECAITTAFRSTNVCFLFVCLGDVCKAKFTNLKNNYFKGLRNESISDEMRRRLNFLDDVWWYQLILLFTLILSNNLSEFYIFVSLCVLFCAIFFLALSAFISVLPACLLLSVYFH